MSQRISKTSRIGLCCFVCFTDEDSQLNEPGEFVKRFDEPTVLRYAIAPGGEFNNGNTTTGHAARKSLDIDATPARARP